MSRNAAVARVVLGVTWCLIGLSKLALPDDVAYARAAHRLATTSDVVKFLFSIIAIAELALGATLLVRRQVGGLRLSMMLAAVFLVYAAWAGSGGGSCGCMGRAVWLGGMPRFGVALGLVVCSWWLLRSHLSSRC